MRVVLFVLLGSFMVVLLWVALANANADVPLSLGIGEPRIVPVAGIVVGGVIAGTLFTGILAVIEGIALRLANRRLRRKLRKLEEEIHDLRNLAFTEELPAQTESSLTPATAKATSPDET